MYATVVLVFLTCIIAHAQERIVTGTVKDKSGEPITGANILIKGTTEGTSTDVNGAFSIKPTEGSVLVFSFIGYTSQEIIVGSQTKIDVVLDEDLKTLDEIVVTGYGEMRKADLTSAQTSISSKDISRTVNTSIDQAIQGRAAGVYVTQNTGAPGGGVSVNIRGIARLMVAMNLCM